METHPGTLYVVAVPIGNLGDFTPRALEVLAQMDYLACEEVQATRRLLAAYSLSAQYLSYRESGREKAGEAVVELLQQGAKVALVAGAGTPAISDPGRDLVAKCREEGLPVVPIPGVSALTAALSVCGLPGRRLAFEGFLPRAEGERRQFLASLRSEERTCVFFEAPHRLLATLELLVELWGERRAFVGRELTKYYEETLTSTLSQLVEHFRAEAPRGEFVLIVEGFSPDPHSEEEEEKRQLEADLAFMQRLGLRPKERVELLTHFRQIRKNKAKALAWE